MGADDGHGFGVAVDTKLEASVRELADALGVYGGEDFWGDADGFWVCGVVGGYFTACGADEVWHGA